LLPQTEMAKKKLADSSTEEKIREAARTVFLKKGYAATRTRDIAEEAGINLALLNYYFRSKEKLFELVMMEKFQKFFGVIFPVLNNDATSVEEKVSLIVNNYIDLLLENPDLPIFVLSEIRNNPDRFVANVQLKKILTESAFVRQLHAKRPDLDPLQLITSLLGTTVFPFLMRPLLYSSKSMDQKAFEAFMEQRRILVPRWVNTLIKTK
jgi:AcrR family transcriptional regulator